MGYTILNSTAVFPAQVSYQLITLTQNIVVTWPFSFASGTIIANINDVNTNAGAYSITLPDATLASVGQTILFNNIGSHSVTIYANDGTTLLETITSGQILYFYLYNNITAPASNGLWRIIPFGEGATSITNFTAQSSDNTITITDGVVTAPNGTINFQLPTSITNLNNIASTGFPVIIAEGPPLTWAARNIVAGNNVIIDDGDGIADNPVINLDPNLTGLTAITVGNFSISGSAINPVDQDTDLSINSDGTGDLMINGIVIDTSHNITNVNNLTVNGIFLNSYTPKAWCTFTDTLIGTDNHVIQKRDGANILSVTGGGGQYTLQFTTARPNNNYGVIVTTATAFVGELPFVSYGFSISSAQTTSSCQIVVVDGSGQLVQQAQYGITVQILSST